MLRSTLGTTSSDRPTKSPAVDLAGFIVPGYQPVPSPAELAGEPTPDEQAALRAADDEYAAIAALEEAARAAYGRAAQAVRRDELDHPSTVAHARRRAESTRLEAEWRDTRAELTDAARRRRAVYRVIAAERQARRNAAAAPSSGSRLARLRAKVIAR